MGEREVRRGRNGQRREKGKERGGWSVMETSYNHVYVNTSSGSDDFVINGSKMWITNGAQADWICLLANTSDGPPHRNKSLICVPMDTPGVTVSRKIEKMGE